MVQRYNFSNSNVPKPKNPNNGFIAFSTGIPYEAIGRTEEEAIRLYIEMQKKEGFTVKSKDVGVLPYDITGRKFKDLPHGKEI